jgi:hypothetical protein
MYTTVIAAIQSRQWSDAQWQALRVASGLNVMASDTPSAHWHWLLRQEAKGAGISDQTKLFHKLILTVVGA